jgi:hypothetical protein
MDNSNKKIEDQQSIAYLQNTLEKKDNLLHRKKLKTQNVDDSKNSHSFEQLCCNKLIVLLMCHDAARCIHRQIFPTCDSTNNKKYS